MVKSGVNTNLYRPYNFEDHIWSLPQNRKDDLLELAQRCVKLEKAYWLRLPNSAVWTSFSGYTDAKRQAMNTWLYSTLSSGTVITADLIETFFTGIERSDMLVGKKVVTKEEEVGSCPFVQGRMVIPYASRFVSYGGEHYVNSCNIDVLAGDAAKLPAGRLILELIYRALCDGEALHEDYQTEADILLKQIVTNTFTNLDFKFVVNWLAAIIQNPGINLQTNLWFLGRFQGVGKGTLMTIMRNILGGNMVAALNQTEIEAGWNDHLFGKLLIEVNEFDSTGKMSARAWDKWIKTHTCEPTFNVRQRNVTSWDTINVSNYCFTSNEESPTHLDKTDRRNQIVATTSDPMWRDFASLVQTMHVIPRPKEIAAGFAFVLEQVKVDFDLIKSAFNNSAKAVIQSDNGDYVVEEWTRSDRVKRDVWASAGTLYEEFKDWCAMDRPGDRRVLTRNKWSRDMKKVSGVEWAKPTDTLFDHVDNSMSALARGMAPNASNTGRLAKDFMFRIGDPVVVVSITREEVAKVVGGFTGETAAPIPDQKFDPDPQLSEARRKLNRIRAELAKAPKEKYDEARNDG